MAELVRPDHRALITELQSPRFELGERQGQWRVITFDWPLVVVAIRARDDTELAFRCGCTGYPTQRPDVEPWDAVHGSTLSPADRPVMTGRYSLLFRTDWESGQHIYHPMDQRAFATHGNWSVDLRFKLWVTERGFTQLCQELFTILHSSAYQPSRPHAA